MWFICRWVAKSTLSMAEEISVSWVKSQALCSLVEDMSLGRLLASTLILKSLNRSYESLYSLESFLRVRFTVSFPVFWRLTTLFQMESTIDGWMCFAFGWMYRVIPKALMGQEVCPPAFHGLCRVHPLSLPPSGCALNIITHIWLPAFCPQGWAPCSMEKLPC